MIKHAMLAAIACVVLTGTAQAHYATNKAEALSVCAFSLGGHCHGWVDNNTGNYWWNDGVTNKYREFKNRSEEDKKDFCENHQNHLMKKCKQYYNDHRPHKVPGAEDSGWIKWKTKLTFETSKYDKFYISTDNSLADVDRIINPFARAINIVEKTNDEFVAANAYDKIFKLWENLYVDQSDGGYEVKDNSFNEISIKNIADAITWLYSGFTHQNPYMRDSNLIPLRNQFGLPGNTYDQIYN